MKVLEKFSSSSLRFCTEGRLSSSGKPRPMEAQYQCEFYKAFNAVVGRGVPISSEWSRGDKRHNGRVDFWIPQKQWGIEFTRDHSEIEEHCNRFKKGGQYYGWVKNGLIKDWIIIDCATISTYAPCFCSAPCITYINIEHSKPHCHSGSKLWYAIFENDYSQLRVFDHEHNCLAGPTALMN
jgi:hypothetical protein